MSTINRSEQPTGKDYVGSDALYADGTRSSGPRRGDNERGNRCMRLVAEMHPEMELWYAVGLADNTAELNIIQ